MRTEDEPITLKQKACSCQSSSSMSHDRTGKPVVCRDTSKVTKFRDKTLKANKLGLSWTDKGSKSSPTVRRRLEKHEFQADYDWRSIQKLSEATESQQEELHRAQADERRRQDHQLLHEQLLKQNWDLREAHEKRLNEMEELKQFQGSTFDTIARRRLVEDQDTFLQQEKKVNLQWIDLPLQIEKLKRQGEFSERFQGFLWSWNGKQLWVIPRSHSSCDCSESLWNARSLTHGLYIVHLETFVKKWLHQTSR